MKNFLFNALATLFVFCLGNAAVAQPAMQKADQKPLAASLLWKIEGEGLERPSYLFGTIHMISQEDFLLTEKTKEAFESTEQVAMEIKMDDPQLQVKMMQLAPMKEGKTLDKLLSEANYQTLDTVMKRTMKVGADMLKNWQPMLLSSALFMDMIEGTPVAYEGVFTQMAAKDKKPISGLETIEDQIAVFENMGYENQAAHLSQMLEDWDAAVEEYNTLKEMYLKGNISEMYDFTSQNMPGDDSVLAVFLDDRNKSWIEPMKTLMKEKPTFFAVGAAHLAGANGVINLLRKEGYRVEAVME